MLGKMKLNRPQYFNNLGTLPLICYLPDATVDKKPGEMYNSPKFEIKTQPGYPKSGSISMFVPEFKMGSPEGLLKFLTLLDKITKGQSLTIGTLMYVMTNNILTREVLRMFEQQAKAKCS